MPSAIPRACTVRDRDRHAQTVAVQNLVLDGLGGFGGKIQGHLHLMGLAPPAHGHSPTYLGGRTVFAVHRGAER